MVGPRSAASPSLPLVSQSGKATVMIQSLDGACVCGSYMPAPCRWTPSAGCVGPLNSAWPPQLFREGHGDGTHQWAGARRACGRGLPGAPCLVPGEGTRDAGQQALTPCQALGQVSP